MKLRPDAGKTAARILAFAVALGVVTAVVDAWSTLVLRSGEDLVRDDAAWMGLLVWAALGVVPWGAAAAVAVGSRLGGVATRPGWVKAAWFGSLTGLGTAPLVFLGTRYGPRSPLARAADELREGAGAVQVWTTLAAVLGCLLLAFPRPVARLLGDTLAAGWDVRPQGSTRPPGPLLRTGIPLVAFHLAGFPLAVATAIVVARLNQ